MVEMGYALRDLTLLWPKQTFFVCNEKKTKFSSVLLCVVSMALRHSNSPVENCNPYAVNCVCEWCDTVMSLVLQAEWNISVLFVLFYNSKWV